MFPQALGAMHCARSEAEISCSQFSITRPWLLWLPDLYVHLTAFYLISSTVLLQKYPKRSNSWPYPQLTLLPINSENGLLSSIQFCNPGTQRSSQVITPTQLLPSGHHRSLPTGPQSAFTVLWPKSPGDVSLRDGVEGRAKINKGLICYAKGFGSFIHSLILHSLTTYYYYFYNNGVYYYYHLQKFFI